MADGSARPISSIHPGDMVLATDPETGETVSREIINIHVNEDFALADVSVEGADGSREVLHTTQNHLFWDEGSRVWRPAGELSDDTAVRTADGQAAYVRDVHSFPGLRVMHNLSVDGIPTYYVLAGVTPVLIHNDGGYTPAPKELPGFPDARRVKPKTAVQGGGGMRARWEDKKFIYEWDSQHGEVEKYNKRGRHLGAFDPETGEMMTDSKGNPKGPIAGRTCGR